MTKTPFNLIRLILAFSELGMDNTAKRGSFVYNAERFALLRERFKHIKTIAIKLRPDGKVVIDYMPEDDVKVDLTLKQIALRYGVDCTLATLDQPNYLVEPVKLIGEQVPNLWHVTLDGRIVGTVSYHGNSLVVRSGRLNLLTCKRLIEQLIAEQLAA